MRYIAILQTLLAMFSAIATHGFILMTVGMPIWSLPIHVFVAFIYTFWLVTGSVARIYGLIYKPELMLKEIAGEQAGE